jgi:tetratricopeptide (TPR) repeat protein
MKQLIVVFTALWAAGGAAWSHSTPSGELAVLIDGTGTYARPISSRSPLVQKFFDQGPRLFYGYHFPEAIASFQEAQRHDPEHPMISWGLAMAMGPGPNSRYLGFPDDPHGEGRKAISAARARVAGASAVERALIESLSVRYDADRYPDRAARDDKYIEATRSVLDRYPDDLEAGFMYADALMTRSPWTYWRRDGSPLPGAREAAAALEHVMALEPRHPGAVHNYVHLFESSSEPERALPQADRLESLMPNVGHVVHMPSHIYVRVGQYDKAIATNERSIAADHLFLTAWGDHPFPALGTYGLSARTHPPHALDFTRYAATLQGSYARAIEAARASAAGLSHMGAGGAQRRIATVWLVHKLFGKWDAVLAEPAPQAESAYLDGMFRYARGSALVGRTKFDDAEKELERLRAAARDPSMKNVLTMVNRAPTILELAAHALEGEIALARGKFEAAVSAFEAAVRTQDSLN